MVLIINAAAIVVIIVVLLLFQLMSAYLLSDFIIPKAAVLVIHSGVG